MKTTTLKGDEYCLAKWATFSLPLASIPDLAYYSALNRELISVFYNVKGKL